MRTKVHLIRVYEEDYQKLAVLAEQDCRSIPQEITFLIHKYENKE